MDIVEFVEKRVGIELFDCQKELLKRLGKLCSNGSGRVLIGRHAGVYIYMDQKSKKELVSNGQTNDCE